MDLLNNPLGSLNNCGKNVCNYKSVYMMPRFTTATTYNYNSRLNYSRKSGTTHIQFDLAILQMAKKAILIFMFCS